jgi:hypothetical protein
MKKGDPIVIHLHGHDQSVPGTVVEVLRDGFIRAEIDDPGHPLAMVDNCKRVLHCSPEMYAPATEAGR